MFTGMTLLLALWPALVPAQATIPGAERFSMRVVTTGLAGPWQMLYGPDGRIWVTERVGKRITRINPADGSKSTAVTIPDVLQTHFQDGLLGMAFHSGFLTDPQADFVYVTMTYDADPGAGQSRRMLVRRYTYDRAAGTLGHPADLLRDLPAGEDHLSGRLVFGHDRKLYVTIGDQGFNQLTVFCQPIRAQDLPTAAAVAAGNRDGYQGKVLRIDLDGAIPADNPTLNGVRSHIYSYGHRNAQGMASGPDGRIYVSEHGPSVDDELNLVQAGKNYGWPHVAGYQDDRAYAYPNWSAASVPCSSLKFDFLVVPPSVPRQKESSWSHPDFAPPLRSFFTVDDGYRFDVQGNATIAPSGIHVYSVPQGGIPGWSNSVLITSLLRGLIYRVALAPDGATAVGETTEYFQAKSRYRDVLASPDGLTIFVAADAGSQEHAGSILAFTYQGGG
jgi:PQQ-dependent dehydrogenase (s-GDH family)